MPDFLNLAVDLAFRPRRALDRILGERDPLPPAIAIYAAYLLAVVAFSAWKPAGFPRPDSDPAAGWLGWLKAEAYNIPLTAALTLATVWFVRLLGQGRLAWRMFAAGAFTVLPALLCMAYLGQEFRPPVWLIAAAWLAFAAGMAPGIRGADRALWAPLVSLLLGVNAVYLAALPLFVGAVILRDGSFYETLEKALALWTLGLASYGVARIARIPTARAFCAFLFASIWQLCLAFALYKLGLMSGEVFKALMTV